MPNAWDLVIDTAGDDTPDAIFFQVGKALTHWEILESQTAMIYSHLLSDGPDLRYVAAQQAYGLIIGSKARAEMLGEVADIIFLGFPMSDHSEIGSQIKSLIKGMGNFSGSRNNIAHGYAMHHTDDGRVLGYFLVPSYYNTGKHNGPFPKTPKYRYNSATIARFQGEFSNLCDQAGTILSALIRIQVEQTLKKAQHNVSGPSVPTLS
jgi:hypothetical protein